MRLSGRYIDWYREGIEIDRLLHWHDQVNSIAVKLNRVNALLLKIRNYVNTKSLRNIYFAISGSYLSYSCIVWAQNINTVRIVIILQKQALRIMNFKDQLFYSSPLFSANNILKCGENSKSINSKSINRQNPSIFNDWFTLVYIQTFRTQKFGHFSITASAIRSCNYTQYMLKINLSLKNSTPTSIKYFLTKHFIESY